MKRYSIIVVELVIANLLCKLFYSCETKPNLISAYIVKEAAVHHSAAALYRQHGYMKLTAKQKQTKVDNSGLLEISDGLQILLRLV